MARPTAKKAPAESHGPEPHAHHGGGGGHDDHGGGGHCPPPWIITFADMATLLMAFFVIMLMTAKTDQPKFNAFAAVMRQTFGTIPQDENGERGGTSVLDLHYGPQSGEQTDQPTGTTPQSGDPDAPEQHSSGGAPGGSAADQAAEALGKAMRDALAQGEIEIQSEAGKVVVQLPPGAGADDAAKIAESFRKAIADQSGQTGAPPGRTPAGKDSPSGPEGALDPTKPEPSAAPAGQGTEGTATGSGQDGGQGPAGTGEIRAEIAAVQMGLLLQDQIDTGDARVERQDGAVTVTLGSGGAFGSGSADLTAQAQDIVNRLGQVAGKARRIVVTGHTDDVPISGGAFRDNWDLASARAGSVVRQIQESGLVPDAELQAVSKGDTQPVADNATPEGREKNRRIELRIEFDN